tara:strand:+ start:72 stop:1598 length:1527 start_codon:yes stop_codon:yes gene_type:complete
MDEDQPKKKITLNNFFEQIVEIDKVAQTALTNSNNLELQFKSIQLDLTRLVQTLSAFDPIQTQLSQVTNIIVQNQIDRGLALDQKEKEVFAAEDKKQKTIKSEKEDKKGIDELKEESLSDQVKNRLKESVKDIREEISKSGALGLGLASLGAYGAGSLMGDRGLGSNLLGVADAATFNLFDFDNLGKPGQNNSGSSEYTGAGGRNNPDKKYNGGEVFGKRNDIDTVPTLLTKGETVASKSETKRMKQSGFTSISGLLSFLENMRKKMFNNFGNKKDISYTAEDYAVAAAIATEGGTGLSATDIQQVIQNRVESDRYPNNRIEVLAAPGQFEGVFTRNISEFKKINNLKSAAKWSGRPESHIAQILKDMHNSNYIADSSKNVNRALEFRGSPETVLMVNSDDNPYNNIIANDKGIIPNTFYRGGSTDNQFLIDPKQDPLHDRIAPIDLQASNIILPPQIVQGTNQTISDGGSRGDVKVSSDSVESTKSPIQSISIAEFNSIENLNILVS